MKRNILKSKIQRAVVTETNIDYEGSITVDEELGILRELIEKENEMLCKMINSLDALEKKMMRSKKKEGQKRKKS